MSYMSTYYAVLLKKDSQLAASLTCTQIAFANTLVKVKHYQHKQNWIQSKQSIKCDLSSV